VGGIFISGSQKNLANPHHGFLHWRFNLFWKEKMMNEVKARDNEKVVAIDEEYVLTQYDSSINYYWKSSSDNKNAYKRVRSWSIILGALVTLISSLASASFIEANEVIATGFAILTPVVAAILTILSGFSQSFHWGATWRDMILNAQRLKKEKDRFLATNPENRDFQKELEILNTIVMKETKSFFQRVLDSEVRPDEDKDTSQEAG
jgi:hypothetical protein